MLHPGRRRAGSVAAVSKFSLPELDNPVGIFVLELAGGGRGRPGRAGYSHSMVAGGLEVTSSTTRLTSRTSLVMRVEIRLSTS